MAVCSVESLLAYRLKRCDDLVSALLHEVEISKVTLSTVGDDGSFYLSLHLIMRYSRRGICSLVAGSDGRQKMCGQVCLLFQSKVLHLDLAK